MKRVKAEILAPAGGKEQLIAAVRCGADAVYLGAPGFNARRNADGFDARALQEAVAYCHERDVKVYGAVNILIADEEIPALQKLALQLYKMGIDGVIVQDFAAARVFRDCCPQMPLHASTQMTVHNRAGVRLLKEYGFSRFVPARELTLEEIAALAAETDMQTEVFVHGALCMSVSGCCYISSMLGGRSGNRGLCAQACRLNFQTGGREYALSLKDMSYMDRMGELAQAGVDSFKIEGRMKRPEYVAAAVTACRMAREGLPYDRDLLQSVFSRSGFTDGYLTGKRDWTMFGFRTKEDVTAATRQVFSRLQELYRKEPAKIPVSGELTVTPEESRLILSDGIHTAQSRTGGGLVPEKSPLTEASAWQSLSKTGGTPYILEKLSFQNPHELFVPSSALNALRREGLETLGQLRSASAPRPAGTHSPLPEYPPHRFRSFYVRFARREQFFDGGYERAFIPLRVLLADADFFLPYRDKIVCECPSLVFPCEEERLCRKLDRVYDLGFTAASADNIGVVKLLTERGFTVFGGMGLNLLNSVAAEEYRRMGVAEAVVSFEMSAQRLRRMNTLLPLTAVVYGVLPLMKYRACPLKGKNGCAHCPGGGFLTDRKGVVFPVFCEERQYTVLGNSVPLDVTERDFAFVDHLLLYFTEESRQDCMAVLDRAPKGEPPEEKHTTGLYYRELL